MSRQTGAYRNGWSVRELAEKTGASPRSIANWTSEPRADYLARADEKRARVRVLRAQGLSIRAIAAETGYSVGTVHRYVKEMNEQVTA
jgi:transposase